MQPSHVILPAVLLSAFLLPAAAQQVDNQERSLTCEDSSQRWNGRQERFCEMREYTIGAVPRVMIDGQTNGGITVKGWRRSDILVRGKVDTWAPTEGEARSLGGQIHVRTAGGDIRADAPNFGRDRGWSVTYEVFVPHRTSLSLKAHNGGIRILDVTGDIAFDVVNGGVRLARLGGNVEGKTTNGGLNIELAGNRWDGQQMDVRATNGGVRMRVPENYSARVEASTVNGGMSVDFPVAVRGRVNRQLAFNLGSGGSLIRATTVNGGVSIQRAAQ
jgi:DUF4097 and DUF4098 domain-containing protein YvlB